MGEKQLKMDLNEEQYHQLIQVGLTLNFSFNLKPGRLFALFPDASGHDAASHSQRSRITDL